MLGNQGPTQKKNVTLTVGDATGSTLTLAFGGVEIFAGDTWTGRTPEARREFGLYAETASYALIVP